MRRLVITISREFGSGGRLIGEKLAEQLGFALYDRTLISMAAKESGLSPAIFESAEDEAANKLLFNLAIGGYVSTEGFAQTNVPLCDQVFFAQSEAIARLGKAGGCVILGRCGNYVLRNEPHGLKVFIYASAADRTRRVMEKNHLSPSETEALRARIDKARANYYEHYTDWKWGDARAFDLALDSGSLGVELAVDLLRMAAEGLRSRFFDPSN